MFTSPNLGLTIWNLLTDLFDYTQLESNFSAIDAHDHSSGKGVKIGTAGIASGAITSALIANNTIEGTDIDPTTPLTVGKVTTNNIKYGTGSVTLSPSGTGFGDGNSGPITHGLTSASGTAVVPTSVVVMPVFNSNVNVVGIEIGDNTFQIWYDNLVNVPTTTTFHVVAWTNAPLSGNLTVTFNWLALA